MQHIYRVVNVNIGLVYDSSNRKEGLQEVGVGPKNSWEMGLAEMAYGISNSLWWEIGVQMCGRCGLRSTTHPHYKIKTKNTKHYKAESTVCILMSVLILLFRRQCFL